MQFVHCTWEFTDSTDRSRKSRPAINKSRPFAYTRDFRLCNFSMSTRRFFLTVIHDDELVLC
jgi:hypothetical protein